MTGEGADEIFGGYAGPTYCAIDYDRSLGLYGGIEKSALIRGYGSKAFSSRREHFLVVNSWIKASKIERDFPGLYKQRSSPLAQVNQQYDGQFKKSEQLTTFDAYLHQHAQINLEGLLNRLDSSTMLASVEGRVPFTDHRLAEKLFKLPDSFKMRLHQNVKIESLQHLNSFEIIQHGQLETKRLLRAAFQNKISPSIMNRKKVSFPVPFIEWFQTSLQAPLPSSHAPIAHNKPTTFQLQKARNFKPRIADRCITGLATDEYCSDGATVECHITSVHHKAIELPMARTLKRTLKQLGKICIALS